MNVLRLGDDEMAKMMTMTTCGCPTCTCKPATQGAAAATDKTEESEVDWTVVEDKVEEMFMKVEELGLDKAEVRKVLVLHKEKSGTQNLSIAHTKLKKSFLKQTIKELGIPLKCDKVIGPKSKTFVKEASKVLEEDGGCIYPNTTSIYCYQIDIQNFNNSLRMKILQYFQEEEVEKVNDEEVPATQSEDFQNFAQSKTESVMYCGLCNHKAGSVGDLKDHMVEDHKKCNICKKYVTNEEDLRIHTENKHAEFKCPTCKKYFAKELRTAHLNSHKENHGFGKTLENVGKITKTITKEKNPDLRAAYINFCHKNKREKRARIDAENEDMPAKEKAKAVTKLLAEEWKNKSKKDKQEYAKQVAEETEQRRGEAERGENVIDMTEENERMQRITSCLMCGKVCLGEQNLQQHLNNEHSTAGDALEATGVDTVAESVDARRDRFDELLLLDDDLEASAIVQETVVEDEDEEDPSRDDTETVNKSYQGEDDTNNEHEDPDLVLIKSRTNYWPAKVLKRNSQTVTIEKFDNKKTKMNVPDTCLVPFTFDPERVKNYNSELQKAFKKAKLYAQRKAMILIN